jgi:O-antigen/teichoic acid export membrane protein
MLSGDWPLRAFKRHELTLLHGFTTTLNLAFSLLQTLIFARVLTSADFSAAIFLISVGLYILPLHQAVARANFALFVEQESSQSSKPVDEAASFFHACQLIVLAASVLAPLAVFDGSAMNYLALASLSLNINLSNAWVSEIQTAFFMTGRGLQFSYISLARRLSSLASLFLLFCYPSFALFGISLGIQAILFQFIILQRTGRHSALFSIPRHFTWSSLLQHIHRVGKAMRVIAAEWLTLTIPYPLFTLSFGVGPALIALDTGLKLLRVTLTCARVLSEAALSKLVAAANERARLRRLVMQLLAASALIAIPVASLVLFAEQAVFVFLLGPHNVVPAGAGIPLALALLASVVFQIAVYLVGHFGRPREMTAVLVIAVVLSAVFAAVILIARPSLLSSLWLFSLTFTAISIGTGLVARHFINEAPNGRAAKASDVF